MGLGGVLKECVLQKAYFGYYLYYVYFIDSLEVQI